MLKLLLNTVILSTSLFEKAHKMPFFRKVAIAPRTPVVPSAGRISLAVGFRRGLATSAGELSCEETGEEADETGGFDLFHRREYPVLISLPKRLGLLAEPSPKLARLTAVAPPDRVATESAGTTGQEATGRSRERVVDEFSRPCRMAASPKDMV